MLRTGEQYRQSLRDGRQVWINGERVNDVVTHPAFKPIPGGAEDRRRLLAFARDLLNSDYAGHRVTFELFAQSPPVAHLNAVYTNFDFETALAFVRKVAGLSDKARWRTRGSAKRRALSGY